MAMLSEDGLAAARELQESRKMSAQMKKREEDLKKIIYQELDGELTGLLASGVTGVHVEVQVRQAVNNAKLQAMYPDVFDAVTEEKETRVLKVDL